MNRAVAGPNAGGTLVIHTDPNVQYSSGQTYCSSTLGACEGATTTAPSGATAVCFVAAAFPSGASPRLSGVTFGIDYDPAVISIVDHGTCADFEITTAGWPASGEGTGLSWLSPRTALLVPVYWFAAYGYPGLTGQLRLQGHPTQGGSFADDDIPALLDPIDAFGALGFGIPGTLTCPGGSNGSGYPNIGGANMESAAQVLLVRFKPGVVSFPESYDRPKSGFTAPFTDATISNPELAGALAALGAEAFQTVAPGWRFKGTSPRVHGDGGPVTMVDFTDVYRIGFSLDTPVPDMVEALMMESGVDYVEGDTILHPMGGPDPLYPEQWGLHNTGQAIDTLACVPDIDVDAPEAWQISTHVGTKIAVIDTHVNRAHEDLQGVFDAELSRSMSPDSSWDWFTDGFPGHGSNVAGVLAATTENGLGMASVIHRDSAQAGVIVSLAIAGPGWPIPSEEATASAAAAALDTLQTPTYVAKVRVANISWGWVSHRLCHSYNLTLRNAVRNAFLGGTTIVASSGNAWGCPEDGPCSSSPPDSCVSYPAAMDDYTIAVTAADCEGRPVPNIFQGSYIDLAAPGLTVWVPTGGTSGYLRSWGTSFAAPVVSGAVALLHGLDSLLTNEDYANLVTLTAHPLPPYTRAEVGLGMLQLADAMRQLIPPRGVRHDSTNVYQSSYVGSHWVEFKNIPELGIGESWDSLWVQAYEIQSTVQIPLMPEDSVRYVWPRGKTSTGIRLIDGSIGYKYDGFFHANHARVAAWDGHAAATFVAYTYRVFVDDSEQQLLCWYPFQPAGWSDACGPAHYRLDYSYVVEPAASGVDELPPDADGRRLAVWPSVSRRGAPVAISWGVQEGSRYRLAVYDVAGRQVRTLAERVSVADVTAREYWDLRNEAGNAVPSGVYAVRLTTEGRRAAQTARVLVLK